MPSPLMSHRRSALVVGDLVGFLTERAMRKSYLWSILKASEAAGSSTSRVAGDGDSAGAAVPPATWEMSELSALPDHPQMHPLTLRFSLERFEEEYTTWLFRAACAH